MAIREDLLKILACPEDKSALHLADEGTIAKLNEAIITGSLRTRGGEKVSQKIEGGLIRADGKFLYVIRADIPVMLIDEALPLN